ncbi:MAG: hypothetical protein COY42_26345 [Armatimonadetes bacterium CG_4_10_14_0_8_um_filter_66_14]|nr:MAG: hypothetical protein COZ57_33945 [Armatimonadetes bacterium CG_4_8_14_3_um_filter_66_20]PIZ35719.1 MAG: hypothetical protein COY42_26345 [Armatimonadetes bacterium CG_4_10_14_0_8_um_filter_66_14]
MTAPGRLTGGVEACQPFSPKEVPNMNFVLILSDTLRWDHLGASGNDWIRTPNLDKLASESLIFDRAYTGSFPTIPHRTDVMTGKWVYPFRGWTPLPDDETILSQRLFDAGYVTMLINDTPHLVRDGHRFDRGFQAWHWNRGQEGDRAITDNIRVDLPCAPEKIRGPERMRANHYRWRARNWKTERDTFAARTLQDAADWIELNHTHDRFFLWVDCFDPHEPWDPPQHYVDLYDPGYEGELIDHPEYRWCKELGLTDAEVRHAKALYAGEVTLVDTWVGRLLEKLDYCGKLDDTVVIFHADHGFNVGDHDRMGKCNHNPHEPNWPYFEEVSHVPLLIRAPAGPRGERNHFLAQGVDLLPTMLELAGLPIPEGVKGTSLAPALRGEPLPERPVAVTTTVLAQPNAAAARAMTSVTDGTWTLHYRGNGEAWDLVNVEDDPAQEKNLAESDRPEAERLHKLHMAQLHYAGVREDVIELRAKLP